MTTTATPQTTTLRMTTHAWDVLVDQYGWLEADTDPTGSITYDHGMTDEGERVTVTIVTDNCQSVDLFEAAQHCIHTLTGWADEPIEILTHDGSIA